MRTPVVLGIDSSTQSTKVAIVELDSGSTVAIGRASHTGESIQHPDEWWEALRQAIGACLDESFDIRGISVAAQQHGLVTIDREGNALLPAPLWNNTDAAEDAERLNELADFPALVGSRLVASFTIAKLAFLARTRPFEFEQVAAVCLPHDWLTYRLTGNLVTDRGDASGTGWWSPIEGRMMDELVELAVGPQHARRLTFPNVLGPEGLAGAVTPAAAARLGLPVGIPVGAGTGDNMGAALGIGAQPREMVISLGTSGTAYSVSPVATADRTGLVAGFADATGHFLPLACMLNCTRVVDSMAELTGMNTVQALDAAAPLEPGAGGLLLVPYFAGERTPNLPESTGSLAGITYDNATPAMLVRAAVDAIAAGLGYCVDALGNLGVTATEVTLVGGGSQHAAWQQAIADVLQMPVLVRAGSEHVARGAAVQAAAVVTGRRVVEQAHHWRLPVEAAVRPRAGMRERFRLEERFPPLPG